jgi:DNA-binding CsgD family transcriptional regulator
VKFDVIGAVEACYARAGDAQAWLSGLLETVSPLARDHAIYAQVFRHSQDGSLFIESRRCQDVPSDVPAAIDRLFRSAPPEVVRRHWSPAPPVDYCTRRLIAAPVQVERVLRRIRERCDVKDVVCVFGADVDGRVVGLFIGVPDEQPLFPPRIVHQLRSVAAHLTSGVRLRGALGVAEGEATAAAAPPPEAVLDPAGHSLDASGPARDRAARETLGDAVRLMEKARGRLRRADPEEALQLWRGLVAGTWSLVEHHDTDGKRYLLARRNQPGVREPTALTRSERSVLAFAAMGHQNKYIGYLLGLSASAVTSHLRSAERKLGFSSRGELIRTFAPAVLAAPARGSTSSIHDRPYA